MTDGRCINCKYIKKISDYKYICTYTNCVEKVLHMMELKKSFEEVPLFATCNRFMIKEKNNSR